MTEGSGEIKVNDRRGQPKPEEKKPEPAHTNGSKAQPSASPQSQAAPSNKQAKPGFRGAIDFSTFIMSMSSSAAVYLGLIEDPATGIVQKNLGHAKQQIDILEMLYHKTQGNLTAEEKGLLEQVLYELKLRYVELSKM